MLLIFSYVGRYDKVIISHKTYIDTSNCKQQILFILNFIAISYMMNGDKYEIRNES